MLCMVKFFQFYVPLYRYLIHMYTGKRPFFSTCLDFLPGTDTGTVPVKCFVLCIFNTILLDPRLGTPSPSDTTLVLERSFITQVPVHGGKPHIIYHGQWSQFSLARC